MLLSVDKQRQEVEQSRQGWMIYSSKMMIYSSVMQQNNRIMSSHIFQLVQSTTAGINRELEHSILRSTLQVNKVEAICLLTDNYLVLCYDLNEPRATHFTRLTFALKFQVVYQKNNESDRLGIPVSIILEKENCPETVTLTTHNSNVLEVWALELQKKINQRNFHKLFKAIKKIGKGAFATVYLAERLRDGKMMAVKAFSKERQYDGEKGKESLENQIKVMRSLDHPNLMKLQGVYETQNSIYIILEYMEGKQLNDVLKTEGKLNEKNTHIVIQNILQGLSYLAKMRVIHRDLKPQNISFKKENSYEVALCDFGLSTNADEQKYLFLRCGTPGFVAPEIINIQDQSTRCDPISDVFSAGVIFHHLLFGTSIFEGKKYKEILSQNRASSFDFLKEPYTSLPKHTFQLLVKMLEKDPQRRISAQKALRLPYFEENKLEEEFLHTPFTQLTNIKSPLQKMQIETPFMSHKSNVKVSQKKESNIFRRLF